MSREAEPPDDFFAEEEPLEEAMEDLWGRTLAQVPTIFGKIAYLASLRNENSGRYQHFGLAQIYGERESDRILRISHEQAFAKWLNFPLERQKTELEEYLQEIGDDRATVLKTWRALEPYRGLAPAAAGDAERLLYVSDLEIILELLQNELSS